MKISFSPIRSDMTMTLERRGEALIINGEVFDFEALPEGASLPCAAVLSDWFASGVSRKDGALALTLVLPISADAPQTACFPATITVTKDGPIALPQAKKEISDVER